MVATLISGFVFMSNSLQISLIKRLLQPRLIPSQPFSSLFLIPATIFKSPSPPPFQFSSSRTAPAAFVKPFCTSSSSSDPLEPPANSATKTPKRNTLVNFSMSDAEFDSGSESEREKAIDKSKLPPPYDPFSKKPVIEEPEDPKNLQEVFHKIRTDGLMNSTAKMFDGLSKDGLTHEALELFSQIKDKGQMPDVVAHTAVIEAYVNAGQAKEGLKVFLRMLGSGVLPNAYTYSVLIRGLVASGDVKLVKEAKKHVLEMVEKRGIKPNAVVCAGVYEGLANVGLTEEGKEVLEVLKSKGVVPEEMKVREAVKDKQRYLSTVLSVLYGK